jgi:hypothetical protein
MWEDGGIAAHILNLRIGWKSLVTLTLGKEPSVSIGCMRLVKILSQFGCCGKEDNVCSYQESNSDPSLQLSHYTD